MKIKNFVNGNKEGQDRKSAMLTELGHIVELRYNESENRIEFYRNNGYLGYTTSKVKIEGYAQVSKVESLVKGYHFTLDFYEGLSKKEMFEKERKFFSEIKRKELEYQEEERRKEEEFLYKIAKKQQEYPPNKNSYSRDNSEISEMDSNAWDNLLEYVDSGCGIEETQYTYNNYHFSPLDKLIDQILVDASKSNEQNIILNARKIIDLINSNITLSQDMNEASRIIVSVHLNNDDIDNAIRWVNEMISRGQKLYHIKEKLIKLKELQNGIHINNIRDNKTLNSIGQLYRELKSFTKGREVYLRAHTLQPRNTISLTQLGRLCRDAGWHDEGITWYEKAINIIPNKYSLNGLGAIYRDLNDFENAIDAYFVSLGIDDVENSSAHLGVGAVYMDIGNYDDADFHFRLAGESAINFLFKEFESYKNNNIIDKAIKCLEQILNINPDNVRAKNELQTTVNYDSSI
jgi:tetratricopeptide (TPR) repeat protein